MYKHRLFGKPHRRIAAAYLIVAGIWILLSDMLIHYLYVGEDLLPLVNIIKGIGFVLVTTVILYVYLRREFNQRLRLEAELRQQVQQADQSQVHLTESEGRFRKAIEEAPQPIVIFAEDGEVLTISRAFLEITGYSREQMPTIAAWAELAYGPDKQRVMSSINRLFDLTHRVDEGEFTIRCADGTERTWDFSSTPLGRLPDGRRSVLSAAADVTERKRAEQDARRSYSVLQRIFDSSHFLLAYMDADFNFIQVNERYAAADGKTPADFVGKNHFELYPNAENEALFRQVLASGEPYHVYAKAFEYPHSLERGVSHWDWSLVPVQNGDGQVAGVVLTLTDVTERVLAEEQLRIKDAAIAAAITPFALADLEGRLTYVNQAFLDLWKLDDESQVLGRSMLEFWTAAEDAQQVMSSIAESDGFVGELTAQLADGTQADVELTAALVYDVQGRPVCMMGSFNDVTKHKQAEAFALDNERLKARFQKEQERNALVQRIISALSHDLRTPLTIISTSRDMLDHYADRLTPTQRHEKLDTIGRQVQFALDLLDDTVNLARGNLGSAVFRPAPVNLAALCRVSVEEIQAADHINHRLQFANLNGTEAAIVDEVLVSRILLNLLSNAIKYSPDNTEVRLELEHRDDWIVLRVVDQGIGISEADLPHIFEPFYRAQGVGAISGTGLGLSIVKDCVERHQGRITVKSQPGQGSTFTVELPAPVVTDHLKAAG